MELRLDESLDSPQSVQQLRKKRGEFFFRQILHQFVVPSGPCCLSYFFREFFFSLIRVDPHTIFFRYYLSNVTLCFRTSFITHNRY